MQSCTLHASEIKFTKVMKTYFALCSAESLLFSSAWSLSISFFFLSMPRSASIAALACVSLSLLYSFSCSSSCCFSLYKGNTAGLSKLINQSKVRHGTFKHHNCCKVNHSQGQNHAQINQKFGLLSYRHLFTIKISCI